MFQNFMFQTHLWSQAALLFILSLVVGWLIIRSLHRTATLAYVLAIDLFILGSGLGAGAWFGSVYPPIFAITSTGILTFFYLLHHALRISPDTPIQDRDIRIAVTGAFTTMYLALVGFGAFMRMPVEGQREAPMAESLVISFTSLVGVVIAFYFGTSAYLEGKNSVSRDEARKSESSNSTSKKNILPE